MTSRSDEAGFGLIEVVVCVALVACAAVFALALLPSLARASQAGLMRTAATGIARNAIERARAAAAYYPPAAVADAAARDATTGGHAWAFASAANYVAAARVHRALCGGRNATTDVPMNVALSYDAASDTLSAAVSYPPDPCVPGALATVSLQTQFAPAAYAPQTQLPAAIADPLVQ